MSNISSLNFNSDDGHYKYSQSSTIGEKIQREFLHLKLLLKKNFLVSIRSYFSTGIEILSPIVFIIFLFLIARFGNDNENPTTSYDNLLPSCISKAEDRCFNLMVSPSNSPSVIVIMNELANINNVKIYEYPADTGDLPSLTNTIGLKSGIILMDNLNDTEDFILKHPNVTVAAVDFSKFPFNFEIDGVVPQNDPLIGGQGDLSLYFSVMVNTSSSNPLQTPTDYSVIMTIAIQNAISNYYAKSSNNNVPVNVNIGSNQFPTYPEKQNTSTIWGGLIYYCGSMITFIFLLYKVAFEKENKLKQGMVMMGLSGMMYWVSWIVTAFTIDLLISLITIAVGAACQLPFFLKSNFIVLLLTFFLFAISMSAVAFFLLTFIHTTKTAIGIGMAIFIVGSIFQLVFSSLGTVIFQLIYQTDSKSATVARVILFFLPMFHFSKILTDINVITSKGSSFTIKQLSVDLNGSSEMVGLNTIVPTTGQSIGYLVVLLVGYTLVAWVLEQIFIGGFSFRKVRHIQTPEFEDEDVRSAINRAHDSSNNSPFIIKGLSKTYTNLLRPSKNVYAVKYLSLSVEQGTILGLLGSNGAGKSTTIGILTGLFAPSSGDALIYGNSVVKDIDAVRKITSVVPQHDILWAEMSAYEHLHLFAELKGIPANERDAQIKKVLDQVRLTKIASNPISTYSGGMKRRLSVAIACIGDPKIIFMDEPTTGMDPASKRHIYTLIKEIKKDKVIVLTSHDMPEVQQLSDVIVIMANGVMACHGNTLQLTNKFGEGYSINIVSKTIEAIPEIIQFVTSSLPGCKFMKQSALQLNFGFPLNTDPNIVINFLKSLEEITKDESNNLMRDWAISHSSLDDVFLKVSHLSKLKTQ